MRGRGPATTAPWRQWSGAGTLWQVRSCFPGAWGSAPRAGRGRRRGAIRSSWSRRRTALAEPAAGGEQLVDVYSRQVDLGQNAGDQRSACDGPHSCFHSVRSQPSMLSWARVDSMHALETRGHEFTASCSRVRCWPRVRRRRAGLKSRPAARHRCRTGHRVASRMSGSRCPRGRLQGAG